MASIRNFLYSTLGYVNTGILASKIKECLFLNKYYKNGQCRLSAEEIQTYIYMADGKIHHGGLADRLKGMVYLFDYSTKRNKNFRINFVSPFDLTEFLIPNEYNWRILQEQITYNRKEAEPHYIRMLRNYPKEQEKLADKILKSKKKQIHIYTNMSLDENHFSKLFNTLFKPNFLLQKQIDKNLIAIGSDYVSVTFRFQQLLGDFTEGSFPILPKKEQNELIQSCLDLIPEIRKKNRNMKVLVTADSRKFLDRVCVFDYVHTIKGDMLHMDFTKDNNNDVYLKSFIDLFLLSKANKIYFAYGKKTYSNSLFAKTASLINNSPYELIKIR